MSVANSSIAPQLNTYKLNSLTDKLVPLIEYLSEHQQQLAFTTLQECCWTQPRQDLIRRWHEQFKPPEAQLTHLTILHYNIRYLHSNKTDLVDMIQTHSPTIVSLNELGSVVPKKTINSLLFSYNVFMKEGTNPHGGVVLAIDKRLSSFEIEVKELNMAAALVMLGDQPYVIASIYSPPTDRLPLTAMATLANKSKNIIIAGDLNAKHHEWGCPQTNTKGRALHEWLDKHKVNVLNAGMNTSLRSQTTIDLIISGEVPETTESKTFPYTCSDHLPIYAKFNRIETTGEKQVVPRTYWNLFAIMLSIVSEQFQAEQESQQHDPRSSFEWFMTLEQFLAALKLRLTEWKEVKRQRPSISPSLRILPRHNHYLQNKYRHTKLEEDRIRVRTWSALVKREFQSYRQQRWERFIANTASPNPTSFWRTVKALNMKKTIEFSALSVGNTIHRAPDVIVQLLNQHFAERHSPPVRDRITPMDKEAEEVWKTYTQADTEDIELVISQSDLVFSEQEIRSTIRSMKSKSSSGFDQVSNKMIKLLPAQYHKLLENAYNRLFHSAHWGEEWKRARTICLNKCDSPAPTTSQLRPISMLPAFSKIYERLFLLRFIRWTSVMNVLPAQQSGARPHQATTSRVNCLLEQVTQSLRYNTFIPVVYVDLLQAFDMLWQQGLLMKLNRLNCPPAYLAWLASYFSNRTLRIDYNGMKSDLVRVERGAPQGSCLGPVMHVVGHHDLPQCFETPDYAHAYVDDIAMAYSPSIHMRHKQQKTEVEERINKELIKLRDYARDWHQPLNPKKTELVVYHRSVQCPKLDIVYDGERIIQKQSFKYLGFHLDAKLAFRAMIDSQLGKARKGYVILKYIHRQFPSHTKLKIKFFNTYIWPHMYMMATIYCLLSTTARERLASFYRRCLRLIHCLFQWPTEDLHGHFRLHTIERRYKSCLVKRMNSIQKYEAVLLDSNLQYKYLFNTLYSHYREKACIKRMPTGRPNKRLKSFLEKDCRNFLDHLCHFVLG